ncbi:MAG: long-chain acyl-CoA synthetase, partial [Pseudomonadota bacterium]|nr:long-chain acyl-CoA synthetase [Pseudomonadota bacterium]
MPDTASRALDTFPRLLFYHAQVRGDKIAMREKDLGIWQSWTWADVADRVGAIACGLAELGFKRGDNLAIIGDNRPHLYMMMTAVQCLGGVPVPLYQDAVGAEMLFVLQDAGVRFALAEDQEQVDKLLEIKEQLPTLEHIVYDDPRGMRHYNQPFLHDIHELMAMGRIHNQNHPNFLKSEIEQGAADDTSVMLYTSGTTGKPKGVCQTHNAFISSARGGAEFDRLTDADDILSYLPMAWVGDHLFSFAQAQVTGFTINCPESGETVMTDLREIGPTYYFAPPRVFENLLTQVMIRMEDAGAIKQKLFHYFMGVARRCGADILDGKSVGFGDRLSYALGNLLIYGPLKNVLGMSRIRVAYTAGAAIGPDLFRFYRSIGINLKQLYGQTETCAYVCLQPDGQIKLDSVGMAAPGVELKIADNGEILVKGPMLLKEYYKRPDATAESINADGYFMTGDAGFFDDEGHLKIIDRAKDVGKLSNGAMFAPNYIENKLKFFQHIKEAVCFGHDKDMVCAFINIDVGAVGNWAERRGIAYSGYTDLAAKPEVLGLIQECVEKINEELVREGMLADSQIHRFLVLHKELDPDDDELTRTRKVRRGFISEKYAVLIDALY